MIPQPADRPSGRPITIRLSRGDLSKVTTVRQHLQSLLQSDSLPSVSDAIRYAMSFTAANFTYRRHTEVSHESPESQPDASYD